MSQTEPSLSSPKVKERRRSAILRCSASRRSSSSGLGTSSGATLRKASFALPGSWLGVECCAWPTRMLLICSACRRVTSCGNSPIALTTPRACSAVMTPSRTALPTWGLRASSRPCNTARVASLPSRCSSCAIRVFSGTPATWIAALRRSTAAVISPARAVTRSAVLRARRMTSSNSDSDRDSHSPGSTCATHSEMASNASRVLNRVAFSILIMLEVRSDKNDHLNDSDNTSLRSDNTRVSSRAGVALYVRFRF